MPGKNNFWGAIAAILAVLGGGATFGWYVFQGTPRYSLKQLQTAIKEGDRSSIEQYIDSEAISTQIVDTAIKTVQQQAKVIPGDILGHLGASIGRGIVGTMRPIMEQQVEQYLNRAISNPSEFAGTKIKLVAVERIEPERAIAIFDISQIPNSEKLEKQAISVVLQQQESRQWKIVGLSEETLEMFARLASSNN